MQPGRPFLQNNTNRKGAQLKLTHLPKEHSIKHPYLVLSFYIKSTSILFSCTIFKNLVTYIKRVSSDIHFLKSKVLLERKVLFHTGPMAPPRPPTSLVGSLALVFHGTLTGVQTQVIFKCRGFELCSEFITQIHGIGTLKC